MFKAMASYGRPIGKVAALAAVAVAMMPSLAALGTSSASAATRPARMPLGPGTTAGTDSALDGVAIAPGGKALAVGSWYQGQGYVEYSLAEQWGGRSWRLQSSPAVGGPGWTYSLSDVAAVSASRAWAVGLTASGPTEQTLIERWNGNAWHRVASPTPPGKVSAGTLAGVAASSPSNAWAVGVYGKRCLAVRWNGAAWKRVLVPSPAGAASCWLSKVAIRSPSSVWAVGGYYTGKTDHALIEHWNGKAWKMTATPNPGGQARLTLLRAVAVTSPSNAWAVGTYQTADSDQPLILHWNGKTWRRVACPAVGGAYTQTFLSAVAAQSAGNAWAVGTFGNNTSTQTVVVHWNGKTWKRVPSPNPGGLTVHNDLNGVAATRFGTWAVGDYINSHGLYRTLVLRWTGKAWRIVASPNR